MFVGRVSQPPLAVALCVALLSSLLAALLPAAALGAGETREYIVSLSVAGSARALAPSSRGARQDIRQRAKRAREATDRVTREHGVQARHRFGFALSGFSARMTPAEAREMAADPAVVNVRPARTLRLAAQAVPPGIRRVQAWPSTAPAGSFEAVQVAIVDTGVGPADRWGRPVPMTTDELNIRGGVNCYDPGEGEGWWGDTEGHGTHVAGIVGARANDIGTVGVAPGASLWSVRVFQGNSGSEAAVACGIDWAVATHTNETPDIDVINLSIQGERLDDQEDCAILLADPQADAMQQAICRATEAGIVVVAAAGNWGGNANDSAPGGFDQVITVGAITDTDGLGGGKGPRARCGGENARDDSYADYSNHGREVDIVAPGTCVRSTSDADPSGGTLVSKTGTSMAAPHVTGAVARYILAHGRPTSAAEVAGVRQIVRAAGRTDWLLASDPVWNGPGDADPPNRVVDVAALEGGPLVRAWVFHERFKVSGSATTRTTRVDVQRGGGFDGSVDLSLMGLPTVAGSASFARSRLNGMGRHDLGTNLALSLRRAPAADGRYDLRVAANGAGVAQHERPLALLIDRTGPAVEGLRTRLRAGSAPLARKGAAQLFVLWQARDALSKVKSARVQRKTGQAAWRNAGVGGNARARVFLRPGQATALRVIATDTLGNKRRSEVIRARLSVRDSASSAWLQPASEWRTEPLKQAFGGSVLLADGPTDALATTFRGKAVAVVASVGPKRGAMQVRLDDGPWTTVPLTARKAGQRKVVWSRVMPSGQHTVEVRGVRGRSALDALLIVR